MVLCAAAYLAARYAAATVAATLLMVGLLVHAGTELFASAAEWAASIGLADDAHRGRTLSFYRLGYAVENTVAPAQSWRARPPGRQGCNG
jgi:hypothetical protein